MVPMVCVCVSCVEVPMRALFANSGFAISVFLAVAITAGLAFIFEASLEIVLSMLGMGLVTAISEYVMQSRQRRP